MTHQWDRRNHHWYDSEMLVWIRANSSLYVCLIGKNKLPEWLSLQRKYYDNDWMVWDRDEARVDNGWGWRPEGPNHVWKKEFSSLNSDKAKWSCLSAKQRHGGLGLTREGGERQLKIAVVRKWAACAQERLARWLDEVRAYLGKEGLGDNDLIDSGTIRDRNTYACRREKHNEQYWHI